MECDQAQRVCISSPPPNGIRQHYGETVGTDGVAHPVGAYYGAPLIVGRWRPRQSP